MALLDAYFIIILVVNGIGMLCHGFIAAYNLLDWAKGRRLNTCDHILLALGIAGFCSQCATCIDTFMQYQWPEAYSYIYQVLIHSTIWTAVCRVWLTACLCVFYCMKIANYNHRVFIWLKVRMVRVLSSLMLVSVVGILALSLPSYCRSLCKDSAQNSTGNLTTHSSARDGDLNGTIFYRQLVVIPAYCMPLLLVIISIIPILTSLGRHTRQMNENASDFSKPRLDAHHAATRMVGALLLGNLVLLLARLVSQFIPYEMPKLAARVLIGASVSTQSIILILGNTKLRQAVLKVLPPRRK